MSGRHIVIIGGGITGLSTAHALREEARRLRTDVEITLLDAGLPGGHARTIREHGFVVEGGPNGFLDREPETLGLVRELGLESSLVEARPESKRRFIVRNGSLRAVPASPQALLTSNALSLGGKLRLLREPFAAAAPAGDVDETVYEFARRRIGREAADVLVDAAVAGISAGDSRAISVRSQFPIMVEMEREHGSLIRAMIARRRKGKGPGRLLSFKGGLATLIDRLSAQLGDCIQPNITVRSLARRPSGWRVMTTAGRALDADHVVLTTSARVASRLLLVLDPALAGRLHETPFSGVSVVALAYRLADIPRALDGYGYLVTKPEGLATLGVVWESSLFPGRAPEGSALLRIVLGGARRPELAGMTTEAVTAIACDELRHVMNVTAGPAHIWTFRWPGAIAQYTVGHEERMKAIRERLAIHDGLELAGTSYDGVSFNHAVAAGRKLGRALALRCASQSAAKAEAGADANAKGGAEAAAEGGSLDPTIHNVH